MRIGDILLVRKKYCPISWLIRKGSKSNYNHVCWALDTEYLIEVKASGKYIVPLSKYLTPFYDVKLLRFKKINIPWLKSVVEKSYYGLIKYTYWSFLWTIYLMATKQYDKINRWTCASFVAYHLSSGYVLNGKEWTKIIPRDYEICKDFKEVTYEIVGRK